MGFEFNGISELRMFGERYIENVTQKVEKAVKVSLSEAWKKWLVVADGRVRSIFEDAVENFYNDYSPILYKREGDNGGGLYNIYKSKIDTNRGELTIWFEPEEMTPFRNGYDGEDGLYDSVFRRGWHGGADKIAPEKEKKYGRHPSEGTPYWRRPYPHYKRWGRKAAISEESPLDEIKRKINDYNSLSSPINYQRDFDLIWNSVKENIKIEL